MSKKGAQIGEFFPGRGWRFFIPDFELVAFRIYIARASSEERDYYTLSASEESTTGGAFYYLGLHRTGQEMQQLLIDWTIRKDWDHQRS